MPKHNEHEFHGKLNKTFEKLMDGKLHSAQDTSTESVKVCGFSLKCVRYIKDKCHTNCGDYTENPQN